MYPLAKITKICVQPLANTSGVVGVFMKVFILTLILLMWRIG